MIGGLVKVLDGISMLLQLSMFSASLEVVVDLDFYKGQMMVLSKVLLTKGD